VKKQLKVQAQAGDFMSDTTPHAIYYIKSWRQIFETLDYEIKNFLDDSENKLRDTTESKLHKVATHPRLMTYNDMINWALERTYMQTRSILDRQGVIIISFRPKHIQVMYKLSPNSKYIYNKEFVSEFQRKEYTEGD
jgi:hypothetical protein